MSAPLDKQREDLQADLDVGGITCRLCGQEHTDAVNLQVWLFGQLHHGDANDHTARLQMYIAVQSTENRRAGYLDFEAVHVERKAAGFVLLGCKNFPPSLIEIKRKDWFSINIRSLTQGWNVPSSTKRKYVVSDYFYCLKNSPFNTNVDLLELPGKSATLSGILDVSINSVDKVPLSLELRFHFAAAVDSTLSVLGGLREPQSNVIVGSKIPHFHSEEGEVGSWSYSWLYHLAEKLGEWRAVGWRLGLSQEDMDMCAEIHSQTQLQAVEMLLLWLDKQHRVDYTSKYKLVQVLKELGSLQTMGSRKWENLDEGEWRELNKQKILVVKQVNELKIPELPKEMISENRKEDFLEEVANVLRKACDDRVAFKSVFTQLESVRRDHLQTVDSLNKAIMQALIELPVAKHQQAVPCATYAKELKQVIDKYFRLLEPRRGKRGAFLLDASVVAGSLMKLLKGNKLVAEEWRDADKRNDIFEVLKDAEIVSEEQATEIIALVTDAMFAPSVAQEKPKSYMAMRIRHYQNEKGKDGVRPISGQHCLALDISGWRAVGLKVGVSQKELDAIAFIYSEKELQALEMLRLWRDKQYYGGDGGTTDVEGQQVSHKTSSPTVQESKKTKAPSPTVQSESASKTTSVNTPQESDRDNINPQDSKGEPSTATDVSPPVTPGTQLNTSRPTPPEPIPEPGICTPQESDSGTQSNTSRSTSPEPPADPSTGEFSAVFDHQGGCLRTYWSDDYLEIPKDAIPKGKQWRVTGLVHTSLDQYQQYVDYDKGERLIAPVVQYRVEGGKHFKELVKVVIHHSIAYDCTSLGDKVSVLLQSESTDGQENCKDAWLPHKRQRDEKNAYFEVDSAHITIYTNHFSSIICKMCYHEHTEDVDVKAILYGRLDQDGANNYSATLKLYVAVQSALNQNSVFFESFHNQQKAAGFAFLGCECLPLSLTHTDHIKKNDHISLTTQDLTQGWNIQDSSENRTWSLLDLILKAIRRPKNKQPVTKAYDAVDYIRCLKKPTEPRLVDAFTLRGKTATLNGMLVVSINSEHRNKPLSTKISFSLHTGNNTQSVSSDELQWKLTDGKLYCVAQKISEWHGVGIKLGISANELDMLRNNMCREHLQQRIAFEMLREWRSRNRSRSKDELKAILQQALESVIPIQVEAVEELNSDTNQVLVAAQVRGDAFVTRVSGVGDVEPVMRG